MTDVCNSSAFQHQLNASSISLILFFDAAHFTNSVDGKVWAILAIVLNLPLSIRQAFYFGKAMWSRILITF
jgi:hypothetical protein